MSVYSEEYRALIEESLESMRALFDASTPDSWSSARLGYGQMRRALEDDDRDRLREHAERAAERHVAVRERAPHMREIDAANARLDECWKPLPHERRAVLVLDVLGEDALTVREITERLSDRFRTTECGDRRILYETYVRALVRRMFLAGQLDREPERRGPVGSRAVRYRYSVRRLLTGPIADLDRRFHDLDTPGG